MKNWGSLVIAALVVILAGYITVRFWPYIFAKTIEGQVMKVEKLMDSAAIITRADPSNKIFSFAVAIKDQNTGEILTASTEDRQWAAVQGENLCAKAKFFPYPPWELDKAGTFYGARLLKLWNCDEQPK